MNLNKPSWFLPCLVLMMSLSLTGCGLFGLGKSYRSDLKLKIAILPFQDSIGLGGEAVEENTARLVTEYLAKEKQLLIVPWSKMEAYVAANNIPLPLNQSTALMVGRALGLNAVVLGSITELNQLQQRKYWRKWFRFLFKKKDYITAVLAAKVVDVESGIVLGAEVGSGETMLKPTEEDLWMGPRRPVVEQTTVAATLDEAMESLADNIIAVMRNTPWKGFVTSVSGRGAIINAGVEVGIKAGQKFVVYSVAEKITNEAGQTYIVPGPPKANLEAVSVKDEATELRIVSGEVLPGETAYFMP
ncbi:MAG: hypothetical protein AB1641_27340 [Thermodesulfobacteriota bacterium]